jgi:hypothetical protein
MTTTQSSPTGQPVRRGRQTMVAMLAREPTGSPVGRHVSEGLGRWGRRRASCHGAVPEFRIFTSGPSCPGRTRPGRKCAPFIRTHASGDGLRGVACWSWWVVGFRWVGRPVDPGGVFPPGGDVRRAGDPVTEEGVFSNMPRASARGDGAIPWGHWCDPYRDRCG